MNPQTLVTTKDTVLDALDVLDVLDVLDTTDPQIQSALVTNVRDLTAPWVWLPGRGGAALTQVLGDAAYVARRVHDLLYTS